MEKRRCVFGGGISDGTEPGALNYREDKILSSYKCPDCGMEMEGGIARVGSHMSECPEKLVSVINGDDVKIVKRKDVMYVQSSQGR